MSTKYKLLIYVLSALFLFPSLNIFADKNINISGESSISLIEKDFHNKLITLDEKAILIIQAIKNHQDLPNKYQFILSLNDNKNLREATPALIDIRVNWELLSDETRTAITQALIRWETDSVYYSPSGFFKLHYNIVGQNAVPSEDNDFNNIPDYIEKCAAYCDSSYNKHLALNYLSPPPDNGAGGGNELDIYFEDMVYYGYTVPEGPGSMPWNDFFSYIVLNNNFVGFPPNNDPEGQIAGAAKATIAHEFHHSIQLAYDYTEDSWFMELDATYMEDIVFNLVDDNYNYLDYFMNSPQTSLMDNSIHKYASFIWGMFLAEKFDTSLMVSAWEGARYDIIYNTLSDTLLNNYGWTQDSAFTEFTFWNYCTSTRNDNLHYDEGSNYPLVSIGQTFSSYPVNNQSFFTNIEGYAAGYITFYPETSLGKLHLTFNGNNSRQWEAYIIKSVSENSHEFEKLNLSTDSYYGEIEIPNFDSFYSVTLVGVNVLEFSTGALFSYSADIIMPYSVSSKVLTLDSAVYSGGLRYFEYQVFNTSPLNDIFNIIYWDDQGWVTLDTMNLAILSGDSAIFNIPIQPQQGTPLDETSILYFKAQSWGDTTVTDLQSTVGKIFLQRGDLDFSGEIDIADIVYFVDYSFNSGPSPLPVDEAADFNCNINVDIADLVDMVEYAFNDGAPPECNPY
ncbi:MAG: MXAN_6640 family putative metalloprotease [Candidatus Zixiibacteriota bacterium]